MKLVMPDQSKPPDDDIPETRARATLTLYPGSESIRFEEGKPGEHSMREAYLDKKPYLGDEILKFKNGLQTEGGPALAEQLTVIIKPDSGVRYGQVIGVLDEMTINDIRRYMMVDAGAK
jgi:hypothetical protein